MILDEIASPPFNFRLQDFEFASVSNLLKVQCNRNLYSESSLLAYNFRPDLVTRMTLAPVE